MATNGDVLINSEEISSVVSVINTISTTLESDIGSSITSNFTALTNAGLFATGISNLSQVVTALASSYKQLASVISTHTQDIAETEQQLSNAAQSNSGTYSKRGSSGGSSGGSSSSSSGGSNGSTPETNVPNVDDGKPINSSELINKIENITDDSCVELVNFLNINKDKNLAINKLLFDKTNALKLVNLLKQYYGYTADQNMFSIEDATLIQKALIAQMFDSNTLPQNITNNTILVAKEYLKSIAKENNIKVEDLLLDDENTLILATSLMDVYDGNGLSEHNVSSEEVVAIREYMDKIAESYDSSVEELAGNPDKFL